jgi:hypothetical protein
MARQNINIRHGPLTGRFLYQQSMYPTPPLPIAPPSCPASLARTGRILLLFARTRSGTSRRCLVGLPLCPFLTPFCFYSTRCAGFGALLMCAPGHCPLCFVLPPSRGPKSFSCVVLHRPVTSGANCYTLFREIEDIFLDLTQKFGFQRDSMRNMVRTHIHPFTHMYRLLIYTLCAV